MQRKIIILPLIILLLLVSIVSANTYPNLGGDDGDFQEGDGNWNTETNLSKVIQNTRTIGIQLAYPVVDDLDQDGVNEIIYLNGNSLLVMQGIDLSVVASLSIGTSQNISNILTYDIDGDGLTEIIYVQEDSQEIVIAEFNGTVLTNTSISMSALTMADSEIMIGCKGTNDCLVVYTHNKTATKFGRHIFASGFNATDIYTNELTVISSTGSGIFGREGTYCLPKLKFIDTQDDVFTFTYGSFQFSNLYDRSMDITKVTRSGSTISHAVMVTRASGVFQPSSQSFACDSDLLGNLFTSVVISDITTSFAGKEYIIAVSIDPDEFKIYTFKNDGGNLDDHPEFSQGRGDIISNPMIMNAFSDTGDVDFCVAGYSQTFDELDLLCGSAETTGLETQEFELDGINSLFNMSLGYGQFQSLVHAVQSSESLELASNLHEVVTPYGIYSLDLSIPKVLVQEYDITINDAVWIPVDYQNVNLFDLIGLSSTNLYYIDDGYVNTGAILNGDIATDPCINAVWQINTSVSFGIPVTDLDGDLVSARVLLYADTINEIDTGWSGNFSSGTTIPLLIGSANKTVSNGILRVMARDTFNQLEIDSIDYSFTVNNQGVNQGDCQSLLTVGDALTSESESLLVSLGGSDDNVITRSINSVNEDFNTGLGSTTIWFLIMLVVALAITFENTMHGSTKVMAIIVTQAIMLVMGGILGFISTALIVTLSIPFIVVAGLYARSIFLPSQ